MFYSMLDKLHYVQSWSSNWSADLALLLMLQRYDYLLEHMRQVHAIA